MVITCKFLFPPCYTTISRLAVIESVTEQRLREKIKKHSRSGTRTGLKMILKANYVQGTIVKELDTAWRTL